MNNGVLNQARKFVQHNEKAKKEKSQAKKNFPT